MHAVKAIVWVHHAGSAQWPRNVSINASSSLPEATSRPCNSTIVSTQYRAQGEPPL